MLEKIEILIVIFSLLLIFYFVISFGAKKIKSKQSPEIKNYLRGVNILILILAIVGFLLWMFI